MAISFVGIETLVQLSLLVRRQGQGISIGGNAVPQIFNQTNAFIQRQVSQIGIHVCRILPRIHLSNNA